MNENTGTTLTDKANGKDATFGSGTNSPVWSQSVFLSFFQRNIPYPFPIRTMVSHLQTTFNT